MFYVVINNCFVKTWSKIKGKDIKNNNVIILKLLKNLILGVLRL